MVTADIVLCQLSSFSELNDCISDFLYNYDLCIYDSYVPDVFYRLTVLLCSHGNQYIICDKIFCYQNKLFGKFNYFVSVFTEI